MVVRRLAAVALLAALTVGLVAGCSGDGEPPDDPDGSADATSAVRDGLADLWAGDHPTKDEQATADCFAAALLERRSTADLAAEGLIEESGEVVADVPLLGPALAEDWVRAQFACTDFYAESSRAQHAATKGKVDTEAYAACLRRVIPEDEVIAAVVASLSGGFDDPDVAALSAAQLRCSRQSTPRD